MLEIICYEFKKSVGNNFRNYSNLDVEKENGETVNAHSTKGLQLLVGKPMAWVYLRRMYNVARNV